VSKNEGPIFANKSWGHEIRKYTICNWNKHCLHMGMQWPHSGFPTILVRHCSIINFLKTYWLTSSQALVVMLVILATPEAEIRKIMVRSQLGKNSSWDPILKKPITKQELVEWLKA
jgi:hypothetical protein